MIGSWDVDRGQVVLRMDIDEARNLTNELHYTIDYRPEGYGDYDALQAALYQAMKEKSKGA